MTTAAGHAELAEQMLGRLLALSLATAIAQAVAIIDLHAELADEAADVDEREQVARARAAAEHAHGIARERGVLVRTRCTKVNDPIDVPAATSGVPLIERQPFMTGSLRFGNIEVWVRVDG